MRVRESKEKGVKEKRIEIKEKRQKVRHKKELKKNDYYF